MGRDERDTRNQWQSGRRQQDDLPDFGEDLGPARSPLQELRDNPFLGDDDDIVEELPAPSPTRAATRPRGRSVRDELPLSDTALLATIAFFAVGGLALIVTGLILSGLAGVLLALVGLLSAICAGLAVWQIFYAGSSSRR